MNNLSEDFRKRNAPKKGENRKKFTIERENLNTERIEYVKTRTLLYSLKFSKQTRIKFVDMYFTKEFGWAVFRSRFYEYRVIGAPTALAWFMVKHKMVDVRQVLKATSEDLRPIMMCEMSYRIDCNLTGQADYQQSKLKKILGKP